MKDWSQANILAIDSSGKNLKLGLSFGGDRLVKSDEIVEQSHGQVIVKKISELFESAAMGKEELDGICVCTGPGSFTGLRIGIAVAKGLAVALRIMVVGVSLFELAAFKLRDFDKAVSVVVPLRRNEFVLADVFQGKQPDDKMRVVTRAELSAGATEKVLACYQCRAEEIISGFNGEDLTARVQYDAADLIYLGREKLTAGPVTDLALLEPLYVQRSQAEIKFDARNKS